MAKRILALFAALLMLTGVFALTANAGTTSDINNAVLKSDGSIAFDKVSGAESYKLRVVSYTSSKTVEKTVSTSNSGNTTKISATAVNDACKDLANKEGGTVARTYAIQIAAFNGSGKEIASSDYIEIVYTPGSSASKPVSVGGVTIQIKNYTANTKAYYIGSNIKLTAVVSGAAGAKVFWFNADGEKIGEGTTITLTNTESAVKVYAVVVKDNAIIAQTDTVNVNINTGFFAKIVRWFRNLFNINKVEEL